MSSARAQFLAGLKDTGPILIGAGASGLVIVLTTVIINLRHALYSASMAGHIRHLSRAWKWVLAYLLTDEAYAVAITHYRSNAGEPDRHWYFLGAGLAFPESLADDHRRHGDVVAASVPQRLAGRLNSS